MIEVHASETGNIMVHNHGPRPVVASNKYLDVREQTPPWLPPNTSKDFEAGPIYLAEPQ